MGRTSTSITALFLGLLLSGAAPGGEHAMACDSPMEGLMEMIKTRMEGKEGGVMGGMHSHMMSYPRRVLAHAEELKLSDEQMGKIMRIELRHHTVHQEIMERMHESMREARRGLMDPAADAAEIRKASKEHSQAYEEMVEDRIKTRDEVHAVLTAEQLDQLKSSMKPKFLRGERRGRHHP